MIRKYEKQDIPKLLELFHMNNHLSPDERKEKEEELNGDCHINVYEKDGDIVGMCSLSFWNNPELGSSSEIILSIDESMSDTVEFNHIAEKLWQSAQEKLIEKEVNHLMASYEEQKKCWSDFFDGKNFEKWFKVHGMIYKGSDIPIDSLISRNYEDEDFHMYYTHLGDCFSPMRTELDIRPHNLYANKDPERMERMRKQTLDTKDITYMFYDGDTFVGSSIIKDEDLDDIFVVPSLQGKGYGRKIVESTIRLKQKNSSEKITLGVLDWNTKAKNLYESVGFEVYRTIEHRHIYLKY